MTYTIKISDTSEKAKSIIRMLKELSKDYSFLKIYKDTLELSEELEKEIDNRLLFVESNPETGKQWREVKASLQK